MNLVGKIFIIVASTALSLYLGYYLKLGDWAFYTSPDDIDFEYIFTSGKIISIGSLSFFSNDYVMIWQIISSLFFYWVLSSYYAKYIYESFIVTILLGGLIQESSLAWAVVGIPTQSISFSFLILYAVKRNNLFLLLSFFSHPSFALLVITLFFISKLCNKITMTGVALSSILVMMLSLLVFLYVIEFHLFFPDSFIHYISNDAEESYAGLKHSIALFVIAIFSILILSANSVPRFTVSQFSTVCLLGSLLWFLSGLISYRLFPYLLHLFSTGLLIYFRSFICR